MTLDEALTKGTRPRVLRRLKISEISNVDRAANPGARVVLTKKATTMARMKCSKCGHEGDASEFEAKLGKSDVTAEQIAKAQRIVFEDIAKSIQAQNPGMSFSTALSKVGDDPAFSEAHRQERRLRLGEGY
jgi:hypothetical protein